MLIHSKHNENDCIIINTIITNNMIISKYNNEIKTINIIK
jgi:hypothetical protein